RLVAHLLRADFDQPGQTSGPEWPSMAYKLPCVTATTNSDCLGLHDRTPPNATFAAAASDNLSALATSERAPLVCVANTFFPSAKTKTVIGVPCPIESAAQPPILT